MRAVVLREGRLEVRETADPAPGPGEMLLRTLSTAICASDVHFMDHPEVVADDGTGRFVYDPTVTSCWATSSSARSSTTGRAAPARTPSGPG